MEPGGGLNAMSENRTTNTFPAWSRTEQGRAWLKAERTAFALLPFFDKAERVMKADCARTGGDREELERTITGCGLFWGGLARVLAEDVSRRARSGQESYYDARMFPRLDRTHPNWIMPVLPAWATGMRDLLIGEGSHPRPDGVAWADGFEYSDEWKPERWLEKDPRRLPVSKDFMTMCREYCALDYLDRESRIFEDARLWDLFSYHMIRDVAYRTTRLYGPIPRSLDDPDCDEWREGYFSLYALMKRTVSGSGLECFDTELDDIRENVRAIRQDSRWFGGVDADFSVYRRINRADPGFTHPMLPHWALETRDMLRAEGSHPVTDGAWDDGRPMVEGPEF